MGRYRWRLNAVDEKGKKHCLAYNEFMGTELEAYLEAQRLSEDLEKEIGLNIEEFELERRGHANQNTQ